MPSTGAISPRRTGRQAPLCAIRDVTERELNGLRQSTQTSACASQRARHYCFIERKSPSTPGCSGRRPCRRKCLPCSRNSSRCPGRSPLPPTQGSSRIPGDSSVPVAKGTRDTAACTSIAHTCDFHAETSSMRMALRVHKPERGDGEVHTAVMATTLAALPSADIAPAISPSRPMQQVPASGRSHTVRSSFEWMRASFRRSHRPML